MNIETTINELRHYTSTQLQILSSAIAAERKSRENERLKELIKETCIYLEKLDATLGEAVEVVIINYDGLAVPGSLDLLNLCEALREYLP